MLLYYAVQIIVLLVLIFITILSIAYLLSAFTSVPYVPTKGKRLKKILHASGLKKGDVFYDLGSGDGRVVFLASKEFNTHSIGIESNPILVAFSRLKMKLLGSENIEFRRQNILKADFTDAHVIYLFLFPHLVEQLTPLFRKLNKGTIIISHGFHIKKLQDNHWKTLSDKPFSTHYYRI